MTALPARLIPLACLLLAAPAFAQTRTSESYSISTETADDGGGRASGGTYAMNGSIGTIAGVSSVASAQETAKAGYLAQIYNVTALQITASAGTVNVGQTIQLGGNGSLDDGTSLVLPPARVAWSVQSGPITSISGGGVATAGTIYVNTPAVVGGSFGGFTASLGLTVINASFDAWQVQYFGQNNPLAAPQVDADGTGETNLFKYIAGLNPINPESRFLVRIGSGGPGEMTISFAPIAPGRSYAVQYCTNLVSANWQTLTGASESVIGDAMFVIDPNSSGPQRFYRVQITY